MKLFIQIPCYNEENTLPSTLADLPKAIAGIDTIETLVIDDGSRDKTVEVARQCGVTHVLSLQTNRGLAKAFSAGLDYALSHGADIVVNTDGDNQYVGQDIALLVQPILDNRADLVVGCRPIATHPEFGFIKKKLQQLGSWSLRYISKTDIQDAASGFRAFSRDTAMRLYVMSSFSYCMETLIQAGNSDLRVTSVPIRINKRTRSSRLFRNIPEYLYRSAATILSMFLLYRPGRFFFFIGTFVNSIALLLGIRFLYLVYLTDALAQNRTYIPSLIFLTIVAMVGLFSYMLGILGEISKGQRKMLNEIIYRQRKRRYGEN